MVFFNPLSKCNCPSKIDLTNKTLPWNNIYAKENTRIKYKIPFITHAHFATKSQKNSFCKMMWEHFTYNPKAKSMTYLTCHIILGSQNELLNLSKQKQH